MNDEIDHRLLRKIRLLGVMAARSTNEHEAYTAAMLAQKLMAENGLSEIAGIQMEEEHNSVVNVFAARQGVRMPRWQDKLFNVLATEFRCVAYWDNDPGRGKALRLIGRSRDCAVVIEVWGQAVGAASRLSAAYARRVTPSRRRSVSPRTSWCEGFVGGLAGRLAEQRRAHQEWALVLVPDEQVQAEAADLHLKAARNPRVCMDDASWRAGWQAGHAHAHDARRPDRVGATATATATAALPQPD